MPEQSSVQTVLASAASARPEGWSSDTARTVDLSREGPFDAYTSPLDTEDSPLATTGLPGCPYHITSYTGPTVADTNPAFGMQLHHPRFLEFIGAPESARLLYHSPMFWVDRLGEEDAMAAAVNLQRDAGIMLSNLHLYWTCITGCLWLFLCRQYWVVTCYSWQLFLFPSVPSGQSAVLRCGCIYVSYTGLFSLPLRVPTAAGHIRFLLVSVFSGLHPCVG